VIHVERSITPVIIVVFHRGLCVFYKKSKGLLSYVPDRNLRCLPDLGERVIKECSQWFGCPTVLKAAQDFCGTDPDGNFPVVKAPYQSVNRTPVFYFPQCCDGGSTDQGIAIFQR
jgi:hypothetical protein